MKSTKKTLVIGIAILLWLLVWQLVASGGFFNFLLASPVDTLKRLFVELGDPGFRLACWHTTGRVVVGFVGGLLLALAAALITGRAADRNSFGAALVKYLIEVPIAVIRSIPIAPLIILLLFIVKASTVSIFIALFISLQTTYPVLRETIRDNRRMVEAGKVYRVDRARLFFIFRLGSLFKTMESAGETALGMAFKAALAAELIAFSAHSLGLIFHDAKVNLDMSLLFAVTTVVILLAVILTKLLDQEADPDILESLDELCHVIKDSALCGLGQTAPNPVLSTMKYFPEEYRRYANKEVRKAYSIDPELCIGCGRCKKACPMSCISGKVREPHVIDETVCIACGACYRACPVKPVKAVQKPGKKPAKAKA